MMLLALTLGLSDKTGDLAARGGSRGENHNTLNQHGKTARSLTSLALRASETVDAGTSVGSDAAPTVLAAALAHRCRRQRDEGETGLHTHALSFFFSFR